MRRIGRLAAVVAIVAVLGACGTIDRAVRGFEAGPGGWAKVSETRQSAMSSDVEYLGASADGLIIVSVGGTVQIWSTGN